MPADKTPLSPQLAPEPLWSRLGIPRLTGNGKFVSASAIDSIGTGLILTFIVVYFAATTSVPLVTIGVAMTVARLLSLPTSVLVGPLIDRFSARRVAAAGNFVSAVGYTGFLFTDSAWSIVAVVFLVQVGHTTYWTSSAALVTLAAPKHQRIRWFGFIHALRNSGMGVGGAIGALLLAVSGVTGLHAITVANAATFIVAGLLLAAWRPPAHEQELASPANPPGSAQQSVASNLLTVLRDRRYAMLIGVNVTQVFAQMLIRILLAIYIVEALEMGAWIAGTLLVLATVQVALTQTVIARQIERHRPTRAIAAGCLLNATAFAMFAGLYAAPDWMVLIGLFIAMIVFTLGEVVGLPAIENLSVSIPPEHLRGRYLGVYQLSWSVGEIAAPAVLIYLLAQAAILPMIFLLLLSLLAIPVLLLLEQAIGTRIEERG